MEDRREGYPEAQSRRDAVKKMAYAAPIVLSLAASPAFANHGSGPPPPGGQRTAPDRSRAQNPYVNN